MGKFDRHNHSPGDLPRRLRNHERNQRADRTARRLEAASIRVGGLTLRGGNLHIVDGQIIAGDPDGAHAVITPSGYRVVNEDGEIDIDLTVGGDNEIRFGSGPEDTQVVVSYDGQVNGRVGNFDELYLDGQNLMDMLEAGGINDPDDSDPEPGTITTTYDASWSSSYAGSGARNTWHTSLNQGYHSSQWGNQRALIGFPTSQIQADQAGRTITRVRVYLYYEHWYFNSGGTAIVGHHGHSAVPSTFSAVTDQVRSSSWPKPGARMVHYDVNMQGWVTGALAGIALGPGPSTSRLYYGRARGHTQSRPPQLEIRSVA